MPNLTIIFYTANQISDYFMYNVQKYLVKAADGLPIISVSQKPMTFGINYYVGGIGSSVGNIYRQVLRGAKEARTKYVALAEDDVFYSREHFHEYRPSQGKFAYDLNRWSLFTWTKPQIYSYREGRRVLHQLICERDLLVDALEERFAKYPLDDIIPIPYFGEPGRKERRLGVTVRELEDFKSSVPSIVVTHESSLGYKKYHANRKTHAPKQVSELPFWGAAENLLKQVLWSK